MKVPTGNTVKGSRTGQAGVPSAAPSHYSGFQGHYIGGGWRAGKQGGTGKDTDPIREKP